jgi:alpha-glucosidase
MVHPLKHGVIYQIYPRSFADANGDGIGDLRGIIQRLDYIRSLGVDAIWLSPIHPSPQADFGYDVADYFDVDPTFGALSDLDHLVASAHELGIRVLLDLIPCHTSIEHPWFREHPDWYFWSDHGPGNNWRAVFGGPAWSRDAQTGRFYMHRFFPEQPDLNWRNPQVVLAISEVIRFWRSRGIDGFRVDALDGLVKDALLRDEPPAQAPFCLPNRAEYDALDHVHTVNVPENLSAVAALRDAAADAFLVGEVYLPATQQAPYLQHLDLAFCFEFLHAPLDAVRLGAIIESATGLGDVAWVMSNHDFPRLASRWGPERARVAAMLLLTLPGTAFIYQGDEIGMVDGPGIHPPLDRAGRDPYRHPMQWTREGGFTTASPWLPLIDPARCNVADQERERGSMLWLYRELIALRRGFSDAFSVLSASFGVLAYRRGDYIVTLNLSGEHRAAPFSGDVVLATHEGAGVTGLPANSGFVARARAR